MPDSDSTDHTTAHLSPQPVYPRDLDLDDMAQRDSDALPMLEAIVASITEGEREPDEQVMTLLRALGDRHALLNELQVTRRDRDSARATVLHVAERVRVWRRKFETEAKKDNRFAVGMLAAADTLADILSRQMVRD